MYICIYISVRIPPFRGARLGSFLQKFNSLYAPVSVILLCPDAAKNHPGMHKLFPRDSHPVNFRRVFPTRLPLSTL